MKSSEPFPGLKAVCLDLGDTIISLDRWWLEVCLTFGDVIKEHFNLPLGGKTLADEFQRAHTRTMLRLVKSDIDYQEVGMRKSAIKTTLKWLGLTFDQGDVQSIFEGGMHMVAGADMFFPGAVEAIRRIGGRYDLCLLSNGYGPWTGDFLNRQGLDGLFAEVVVSSDVGVQKPDPRIFELALERLGLKPREAVMVGDYYDTDIRGGIAAGMRTIWINPAGENPADGPPPDTTVREIAEVPASLGLK
jgi:FMN phosphatase YigB (HAD superfamily)